MSPHTGAVGARAQLLHMVPALITQVTSRHTLQMEDVITSFLWGNEAQRGVHTGLGTQGSTWDTQLLFMSLAALLKPGAYVLRVSEGTQHSATGCRGCCAGVSWRAPGSSWMGPRASGQDSEGQKDLGGEETEGGHSVGKSLNLPDAKCSVSREPSF